ncbi:MAG: DUF1214 domain-containing protein [Actinomycetota bacterium]
MTVTVNVDNFVRAETARMFDGQLALIGGVNSWGHARRPQGAAKQSVIRMNRDTLYSIAIVDLSAGAALTIPDSGDRYMSVQVVNEDHYTNRIFSEPGTVELTVEEFDTEYVALIGRTFVDPDSTDDIAAVHALQDALELSAAAARPFTHPDYDAEAGKRTARHLNALAGGLGNAVAMFGSKTDVDPVHHLIGTAMGWGGLPEHEAFYISDSERRPTADHTMTLRDVPADAFWSVTVYNRDGFLEANEHDRYSLNSVTATPADDGSVTVLFSASVLNEPNWLPITDGWNYTMRLYQPRPTVLDGSWTAPVPEPA